MQANTLTLSVDPLNDDTIVAEAYDRFEVFSNRSVYIGANHAAEARDTISLYRSFPTKSGNFKGVNKSSIKLSRDNEVAGVDSSTTLTAPTIIEVSFSVPVGATAASLLQDRQRLIALLDDDAVMDALNLQLMI